ncbi:MAG: hypothetical protein K2Y01_04275 [Rhabdochlamydiaceae bacterium]|nr:hypothetical protein [Rhabdochlamydiaceae bacterium]
MTKKTATESFSDNFWSSSSDSHLFSTPSSLSLNLKKNQESQLLHSVDESPEFHDPYSDLSLFLSHRIKQEMDSSDPSVRWTVKLQEELLSKITPEFQKKFPQYRLGVTAVKKIWNKVLFYTQQMQGKTEALDSSGKLNINFFIKENLRQYFQQKAASFLSPYQSAYQIACKMSECIATLEGTKPKLDFLTQTIWSLQKHLLNIAPLKQTKSPYDEFDKIDKLIVKTILENTAKHPHIGLQELEHKTKESLQALHDLPDFSSTAKVTCNVSAILSEKLYATSPFHFSFFAEQKEAVDHFISKHSSLYKNAIAMPQLPDLVRRILALYTLASQLPKSVSQPIFYEAVEAVLDSSKPRPELNQAIYAFLSAELLLLKHPTNDDLPVEEIKKHLFESYQKALLLPSFQQLGKEQLEILIWKSLSETEGFLEKIPYRIGQKIEQEIAGIFIDDPTKPFSSVVHETVQFFQQVKELTETKKWNDAHKKIHLWSIQNDMLCRSIRLNADTPLAKIIRQKFAESKPHKSHSLFISEVCQEFVKQFPAATIYLAQLSVKAWILYKYLWFTMFSEEGESSLDRFFKWHIPFLQNNASPEELVKQLEDLCKKCLPLIPFDAKQALAAIATFEK